VQGGVAALAQGGLILEELLRPATADVVRGIVEEAGADGALPSDIRLNVRGGRHRRVTGRGGVVGHGC
jgi:hypothetical protein